MADFRYTYERTKASEAGYSNRPTDPGGETWRGVARVYHPGWAGWPIVDSHRKDIERGLADASIGADRALDAEVEAFYREQFWAPLLLDQAVDDHVAFVIYDFAFLFGPATAIRCAQVALNVLNSGGLLWADIDEDGAMGPGTMAALNMATGEPQMRMYFEEVYGALRIAEHVKNVAKRPALEEYMRGWLNRIIDNRKG